MSSSSEERANTSPWVFALGLAIGPALALGLLETVVDALHLQAGRILHLIVIFGLATLVWLRVAKTAGVLGPVLAVVAVALGVGFTVLWQRADPARQFVRFAAVPVVFFLASFLLLSPTARLYRAEGTTGGASIGNPKRVVMLVLDEFPLASLIDSDGNIDRELYPGFARLADSTSWYRNATSVASSTGYAVPAIVAGDLPEDSLPIAQDHPHSLFTMLGGSYDMQVTESITRLCPASLCDPPFVPPRESLRLLAGDARDVLKSQLSLNDGDSAAVAGFVDDPPVKEDVFADFRLDQPERLTALLDSLGDTPEQTLHYLHILLPHQPWRYLPSGRRYIQEPGNPGEADDLWTADGWPPRLAQQRHLLQAQYVDRLVGALLDRMEETGVLDDSLLIVVADHGVAFQPGQPVRGLEQDTFDKGIYPQLMWVPLFIRRPGPPRGEVVDTNVMTIDVLPTIADVLDVDLPWELPGRSVDAPPRQTPEKVWFQNRVTPGFGASAGLRRTIDGKDGWRKLLGRTVDSVLPTDGPMRTWRIGPRPDLIGQAVTDLAVGPASGVRVRLDEGGDLSRVPANGPLPALVTGSVQGAAADATLLYALNGRVAAVAPTLAVDGPSASVAALLTEDLFVEGENSLAVYLLGPNDEVSPVS